MENTPFKRYSFCVSSEMVCIIHTVLYGIAVLTYCLAFCCLCSTCVCACV